MDQGKSLENTQLQNHFLELAGKIMELLENDNLKIGPNSVVLNNPTNLSIIWSDGVESHYKMHELQSQCPCAGCVDEITGMRKSLQMPILENLAAKKVKEVGRYAIQVEFLEGCSYGIFDYKWLRKIKGL